MRALSSGMILTIEQVQVFDRKKKERVSTLRFIVRKNGKLQSKGWNFYLLLFKVVPVTFVTQNWADNVLSPTPGRGK